MREFLKNRLSQIIFGAGFIYFILFLYRNAYKSYDSYKGTIEIYLYSLIPGMFILILLVAIFIPKPKVRNQLALLVVSVFLVIFFSESAIFIIMLDPIYKLNNRYRVNAISARKAGKQYDERTKLEVVRDLRKKGINAFPNVPPCDFCSNPLESYGKKFIPLSGIVDVTTVYCNESGEYLIYQSDEHGFHNPKGLYKPGAVDILIVGDSFAHGAAVNSDKNSAALIRNVYPGTINLGSGGNGPLTMLAAIKDYGMELKPKIVLWLFYEGNDFIDLNREKKSLLINYLKDNNYRNSMKDNLQHQKSMIDFIEKQMDDKINQQHHNQKLSNRLKSIFFLGNIRKKIHEMITLRQSQKLQSAAKFTKDDLDLFRQILVNARDTVNSWKGQLYFVYLPEWERFHKKDYETESKKKILSLVNQLDIPVIDVCDRFCQHQDPLSFYPWRTYNHFNEAGYKLVADTILSSLPQTKK